MAIERCGLAKREAGIRVVLRRDAVLLTRLNIS